MTATIAERVRRGARWNPFSPERCARRGARFMDRKCPGWAGDMDVRTLQISGNCVFYQRYGSYKAGYQWLLSPNAFAPAWYGFAPWALVPFSAYLRGCAVLTPLWLAEIRQRLQPEPAPVEDDRDLVTSGAWNCPSDPLAVP